MGCFVYILFVFVFISLFNYYYYARRRDHSVGYWPQLYDVRFTHIHICATLFMRCMLSYQFCDTVELSNAATNPNFYYCIIAISSTTTGLWQFNEFEFGSFDKISRNGPSIVWIQFNCDWTNHLIRAKQSNGTNEHNKSKMKIEKRNNFKFCFSFRWRAFGVK